VNAVSAVNAVDGVGSAAAARAGGAATGPPAAGPLRITAGSPTAEEVAAVVAVLSTLLRDRATASLTSTASTSTAEPRRRTAPWTPALATEWRTGWSTELETATGPGGRDMPGWATRPRPGWRAAGRTARPEGP
jgi:hypothetical protein